jgi:drug/metabolite transporter (DMT)-like permease
MFEIATTISKEWSVAVFSGGYYMFSYLWPIGLVVLSNIMYQICAKEVPSGMNAFASLTVTYVVAAISSVIFFFLLGGSSEGAGLMGEYSKINWAPFVLGVAIVGLEVGWIFAYKAGWEVSTGFIVQSAVLAIFLLALGYFMYHEVLTWNKLVGVAVCLIGLVIINLK